MRPIDADALKEQLEDWLKQIQGYTSDEHEITRDVLMSVIHSCIADTPTLDVQPVCTSEWVTDDNNNDDWAEPYCKKCGCLIPHGPANFCPNCGADMRQVSK